MIIRLLLQVKATALTKKTETTRQTTHHQWARLRLNSLLVPHQAPSTSKCMVMQTVMRWSIWPPATSPHSSSRCQLNTDQANSRVDLKSSRLTRGSSLKPQVRSNSWRWWDHVLETKTQPELSSISARPIWSFRIWILDSERRCQTRHRCTQLHLPY